MVTTRKQIFDEKNQEFKNYLQSLGYEYAVLEKNYPKELLRQRELFFEMPREEFLRLDARAWERARTERMGLGRKREMGGESAEVGRQGEMRTENSEVAGQGEMTAQSTEVAPHLGASTRIPQVVAREILLRSHTPLARQAMTNASSVQRVQVEVWGNDHGGRSQNLHTMDPRLMDPRLRGTGMESSIDPGLRDTRTELNIDPRLRNTGMISNIDPRFIDPRLADPRPFDPRVMDPRTESIVDPRLRDPVKELKIDPRYMDAGTQSNIDPHLRDAGMESNVDPHLMHTRMDRI